MTLPSNTQIALSQVNTELGKSSTAQITMNDSDARSLAGRPSGQIAMSDFWGKSSGYKFYYYMLYVAGERGASNATRSYLVSQNPSGFIINGAQVYDFSGSWTYSGNQQYTVIILQGTLGGYYFNSISGNGVTLNQANRSGYFVSGPYTYWYWYYFNPNNVIYLEQGTSGGPFSTVISYT